MHIINQSDLYLSIPLDASKSVDKHVSYLAEKRSESLALYAFI